MPCFELFRALPAAERQKVIGTAKVKVAVEAAVRQGWDEIIGSDGAFVGMTGFGASAPDKELYRHFGITAQKVAEAALDKLSGGLERSRGRDYLRCMPPGKRAVKGSEGAG